MNLADYSETSAPSSGNHQVILPDNLPTDKTNGSEKQR